MLLKFKYVQRIKEHNVMLGSKYSKMLHYLEIIIHYLKKYAQIFAKKCFHQFGIFLSYDKVIFSYKNLIINKLKDQVFSTNLA